MTGEVVLSAALRSNLLSLQRTQSSIDKVQNVLATGLKVSSALDNPQSFFASQALKNRSSDLTRLLDGIGQSIQTIKAADAGVTGLTKLVEQAQSIVDSARDAITGGAKEAAVTGSVDLSGTTNLTSLTGIPNGAHLVFDAVASDGTALTLSDPGTGAGEIAIATNDSIEQLVGKINDLTDATSGSATNGEQLIKAELTSAGKLKLTGLHGVSFNVRFDSDGDDAGETAANGVADNALAAALGFGTISKAQAADSTTLFHTGFTATNNTKLVSGVFYDGTSGFADASDTLVSVRDAANGGGNARFVGQATNAGTIDITVNDKAVQTVSLSTTQTIQGLVDSINDNAVIGDLIQASYDATTGKFTIEATSAEVSTIKIGVTDGSNAAVTDAADFDFGVDTSFAPGVDTAANSENFVLASAASILSQYEDDYNTVRAQIDELVEDAGYRGVNLINGDDLDTFFNEDRSNKLTTAGSTLSSSGLGLSAADFSRSDTIEAAAEEARAALTTLRSFGGTLSNSLSIIQTRENFTKSLVETLDEGSDKLTIADQNEEGAKLLALQTRQQLGITALSLAAQAQQSVLRLF